MSDTFFSRIRLSIVAELLEADWITFAELQRATSATKGNLGSHLMRLVAEGTIKEEKRMVSGRQQTRYRLTASGRAAFLKHVAVLEDLLRAARREYTEADAQSTGLAPPKRTRVPR